MARSLRSLLSTWRGRALLSLLLLLSLLVGLFIGLWLVLNNETVSRQAVAISMPKINSVIPGEIRYSSFHGSIGNKVILEDVSVFDERGELCLYTRRLEAEWDLWDLSRRAVEVRRVKLEEPQVLISLRRDGSVNLSSAFVAGSTKGKASESPQWTVALEDLSLEKGSLLLKQEGAEKPSLQWDDLSLRGAYLLSDGRQSVQLDEFVGSLVAPLAMAELKASGAAVIARGALDASGIDLSWRDTQLGVDLAIPALSVPQLKAEIEVARLALADIGHLTGESRLRGALIGNLQLSGPPSSLTMTGEVRGGGGTVTIEQLLFDQSQTPPQHKAQLLLEDLALEHFVDLPSQLPPSLSARAVWTGEGVDLQQLKGSLDLVVQSFELAGRRVEVPASKLLVTGKSVQAKSMKVLIAGGSVEGSGLASLETGEFRADLQGSFPRVEELVAGYSGDLTLETHLRGHWNALKEKPFHSDGRASIQSFSVGDLRCEQAEATWDLEVGLNGNLPSLIGPLELRADRLIAPGVPPLARAALSTGLRGRWADIALTGSDGPELLASIRARVDWTNLPSILLEGESLELLAGDFVLQSTGPFSLRAREGRFTLNRLMLASSEGTVSLQALFDSTKPSISSTVRIQGFGLAQLESAIARLNPSTSQDHNQGIGGVVDELVLKVSGKLIDPEISIKTSTSRLTLGGYGPLDLEAALHSTQGTIDGKIGLGESLHLELNKVPLSLRLAGKHSVELDPSGIWDVTARLARSSVTGLAPLLGRALHEDLEGGTIRGGLTIGGSSKNPSVRLDLGLSDLQVAGQRLHGQLGFALEDGIAQIEDALLKTASSGRVLELDGSASADPGSWLLHRIGPDSARTGSAPGPLVADVELKATTRKLPMSLVHILVPSLTPLTGALQGQLEVTGKAEAPVARAQARLLGGRVAREELQELRLDLGLQEEKVNGELHVQGKSGGSLDAELFSSLRVASGKSIEDMLSSPDLQAQITGDGFPLALVTAFIPGTSEPAGALRIDGQVTGSLWSPKPQLALEIVEARLCHEQSSVCYEDLRLDATLETGRLALRELAFRTIPQVRNPLDLVRSARSIREDARFASSGFVLLDGLRPKWTELDLNFEGAWASYTEQIKLQVDGGLRIRGYYPALKLSGKTDLQNVRVDLGRSSTRREIQSLELSQQLRIHRSAAEENIENSAALEVAEEEAPTVLDRLLSHGEADITLRLGNNVRTALAVGIAGQGNEALSALNLLGSIEPDLVLGGELNLRHKSKESAVIGAIKMQRGSRLTVLTRDFEVEEGSFIEFVGKVPDSQLNLRATYSSRYGPVTVVVSERMASPSIRFESEVFEDQADILSVLVTGKPIAELSSAEGSQALSGVAGALAGFGTKAFGKYTPFDSLIVDLGDDLSSGSAEAGKALGPKVFLVTRFRWGTEEEENRIEGQLEVQINPRLYLETVMGDRLQGAIQLVWKRQF
jgi:hypothetical protein